MSSWIRNEPGPRENAVAGVVAGLVGAGLAAVVFYVLRLLLARDPVGPGREVVPRRPEAPAADEER